MRRRLLKQRRFGREHAWSQVRLGDYLDGELGSDERRRVEEHVSLCPECRAVLETLRETLEDPTILRTPVPADLVSGIIERLREEPRGR